MRDLYDAKYQLNILELAPIKLGRKIVGFGVGIGVSENGFFMGGPIARVSGA